MRTRAARSRMYGDFARKVKLSPIDMVSLCFLGFGGSLATTPGTTVRCSTARGVARPTWISAQSHPDDSCHNGATKVSVREVRLTQQGTAISIH